jgi:hypothetical protein
MTFVLMHTIVHSARAWARRDRWPRVPAERMLDADTLPYAQTQPAHTTPASVPCPAPKRSVTRTTVHHTLPHGVHAVYIARSSAMHHSAHLPSRWGPITPSHTGQLVHVELNQKQLRQRFAINQLLCVDMSLQPVLVNGPA